MKFKQILGIGIIGLASLNLLGCSSKDKRQDLIRISKPTLREWKNYENNNLRFRVTAYDAEGISSIKYFINDQELKAGLFACGEETFEGDNRKYTAIANISNDMTEEIYGESRDPKEKYLLRVVLEDYEGNKIETKENLDFVLKEDPNMEVLFRSK
ncbi:MAG: hypothetical protein KKA79_08845 [Nanoarchaeota archaeon]|nr:hypothetical protein [Nanoarchaeota archaeon]MCG2717793.1 hypothetical protein [Nanoarchaeota archaeon]